MITPDRVAVSEDRVASLVAPGEKGYLGVLANRAPLITELGIGKLTFRRNDATTETIAVSGGYLEVAEHVVTVLADCAEIACEIDVERAENALQRARERLASPSRDIDVDRARLAAIRAINRLRVAGRGDN